MCEQIAMQNSVCTDYLIPHTHGTPKYLQIIHDPVDRRNRKSSQGSSRHSSVSSDIYSLNSTLQVALPPLKQYESIHSIDAEQPVFPEAPYSTDHSIPEGYEFVPYPSHLTHDKIGTPEGYAIVSGPPRRVSSSSMHDGNCAPSMQHVHDGSVPAGYTMVNIPTKKVYPVGSSNSAEIIMNYPHSPVERPYNSAEARLYYTGRVSDLANNIKNRTFYPHIALTDSRNYVDCNRNKASYLSLASKSGSDLTENFDAKLQAYWANSNHPSGGQDSKIPGGRSRGQVYPLSEALVSGYSDVQASLV